MTILSTGTVIASGNSLLGHCCFASSCVLPGGRWLVAYRDAVDKESKQQHCMLRWSDDQGRTWSSPIEPFAKTDYVPDRIGSPRSVALTRMGGTRVLATLAWLDTSNPARAFFDHESEALEDMLLLWSVSENGGATWSRPQLIDTGEYATFSTPSTGPTLISPAGDWICHFELNKRYGQSGDWRHLPVVTFSRDQGRTWSGATPCACAPDNRIYYWDQRPAFIGGKTILNPFWTFDRTTGQYLSIHASISRDAGRTWSPPFDTGIPGQPANPVRLPDGRIVLVHVNREGLPDLRYRVSDDNGQTWPAATECVIASAKPVRSTTTRANASDAWNEMVAFNFGLPAAAGLGDGRILVTYYAAQASDKPDIAWLVIAP